MTGRNGLILSRAHPFGYCSLTGGCPYAKGATGNVATEDIVYMMQGLGIETDVDMTKLLEAAQLITKALGKETASRAGRALLAKQKL